MRRKRKLCVLDAPLTIAGETLEWVDSFTFLESVARERMVVLKNSLSKARNAFACIRSVWRSPAYSTRTKLHLYNSIVKSVLWYESECWQVVEADIHKIEAFYNGCLRRSCRIFLPRTILNLELHAKTNSDNNFKGVVSDRLEIF